MRFKIGDTFHGLGNLKQNILNNNWPEDDQKNKLDVMLSEALEKFWFLKDLEYCDFQINEDEIKIGIEPSYQFDRLFIITIKRNKLESTLENGVAFGNFGTSICIKEKTYKNYKLKTKFTRFVDKYHEVFFGEKNGE